MPTAPPPTAATAPPAAAGFAALVDAGRLREAADHAVAGLGPRLAVWWGALCVWRGLDPADEPAAAAIDAAVAWVLDPSETNRRAAESAGAALGPQSPAGAIALAAFWSEGSISLPGQPDVPPPAGVAERLAAGAVQMAIATAPAPAPPPVAEAKLRQALRFAAELLAGENLPPAVPSPPVASNPP